MQGLDFTISGICYAIKYEYLCETSAIEPSTS